MKPERRYFTHEFRVSPHGEAPKISGYAAVFDVDSEDMGFIEQIDPHAFDSVLAARPDVCALWNHNPDVVLGRTTSGTLQLKVDARGLAYEVVPPDTQAASDLLTLMRRGDVNGSSFGFITKRDQWTDNPDGSVTRRILEFDALFDVSPVTYPAFPQTSASVRSLPDSIPAEFRSRIEARRKTHTKMVDGANLTDDCFLIVGDPNKTDTWDLPWKFPDEAKTISHLRDALTRFNQVKGVSDEQLKAAWDKLMTLCKEHGISVSDPKMPAMRALTDQCTCTCPQCLSGNCGICSADPQCQGAERSSWRARTELLLRLAEAE